MRCAYRTHIRPWLTFILILCLGLTHLLAAQGAAAATLQGKVTDPDDRPIDGVLIFLRHNITSEVRSTQSDSLGEFRFRDLPAGDYELRILANGFKELRQSVALGANEAKELDFQPEISPLTQDVTVTATGSAAERLMVPGEVSVISREEIDRTQARSLDDLFRYEAGVEMSDTLRRSGQSPNIRGFNDERVLVVRDGARINQFTSGHKGTLFLDVDDVERIEVVRGPASSLYGSGALGGVVSITTRDPADLLGPDRRFGANITSSYSTSFNEWMASSRVYGASEEGFQWMLGYTARQNDGSASLAGEPDTLDLTDDDIDNVTGRAIIPFSRRDFLRVSVDYYENDVPSLTNLANTVVGDGNFVDRKNRQQSYAFRYERQGTNWFDRGLSASFTLTDLELDETRFSDARSDRIDFLNWGIDVRNVVPLGENHRLTYGVEHFQDEQEGMRDAGASLFFPDGTQKQTGIFLQDEISLLDYRLSIVPGVRFDLYQSENDDPEIDDIDEQKANPKIGASFKLIEGLVLTGNFAQGFRAPRFQELFISGTHFAFPLQGGGFFRAVFQPNPDLEPETSRNVEAGLRLQRGRLSIRANYWRTYVDDFIDLQPVSTETLPGGLILQRWQEVNVEDAILEGVEVSSLWSISDEFTAIANYSNSRGNNDVTGDPLASIQPEKLVFGLDWNRPLLGLTAGLRSRSYGRIEESVTTGDPSAGYSIFDLHAAWTPQFHRNLTLRFNIDNLADRSHIVPLFGLPGIGRDYRIGFTYRLSR